MTNNDATSYEEEVYAVPARPVLIFSMISPFHEEARFRVLLSKKYRSRKSCWPFAQEVASLKQNAIRKL